MSGKVSQSCRDLVVAQGVGPWSQDSESCVLPLYEATTTSKMHGKARHDIVRFVGSPAWIRTRDLPGQSRTLWLLSYRRMKLVVPARFERATPWFKAKCSSRLSYGTKCGDKKVEDCRAFALPLRLAAPQHPDESGRKDLHLRSPCGRRFQCSPPRHSPQLSSCSAIPFARSPPLVEAVAHLSPIPTVRAGDVWPARSSFIIQSWPPIGALTPAFDRMGFGARPNEPSPVLGLRRDIGRSGRNRTYLGLAPHCVSGSCLNH